MNSDTDYSNSGFDKFLSRPEPSFSNSLDNEGSETTMTNYDRGQQSGSIGDNFKLGGIQLSGSDNTVVLNDGTLSVNDTSTSASVKANSANINYYDSFGNLVVQEGILNDGATGIRIVDKNNFGIAQFGRNKDGTTTIKIAKAGVEVTKALDSELIFNSAYNLFKIVKTGTTTLTTPDPMTNKQVVTATIPHGLSTTPAFIGYVTPPDLGVGYLSSAQLNQLPLTFFAYNITPLLYVFATADTNNFYLKIANLYDANLAGVGGTWNFRYYILQETSATS